jgi:hypothetical protein
MVADAGVSPESSPGLGFGHGGGKGRHGRVAGEAAHLVG